MDQREFMRQMQDLVDLGRAKENVLTKEEIADYCGDLSLTEEQLTLVYAYLKENRIQIPGTVGIGTAGAAVGAGNGANARTDRANAQGNAEAENGDEPPAVRADSQYLTIYRRELRALPERTREELEELYLRLARGEEESIHPVVEAHLKRVLTLAGKYRGRGVPLEDLIQEGNLELMMCVSMLCGSEEATNAGKAIDHAVRSRLIELVDEHLEDSDNISSVLARMNLLREATNILAEEYGRVATRQELAEFTRMDEEEIQMYVDFSRNKIELGTGEPK